MFCAHRESKILKSKKKHESIIQDPTAKSRLGTNQAVENNQTKERRELRKKPKEKHSNQYREPDRGV